MRLGLAFFGAAAAAIVGVWAWLGAPVAMPPSPLGPNGKLDCVSYAPFRNEQNPLEPGTFILAAQIESDLERLSHVTGCVRTYSIEHGVDQVAELAGKFGLKVMQGLWLSSHPERNTRQIKRVIALANQHRDVIRSVVVGNEVLLRGEMSPVDLAATIRQVKAAVPVPVTYADVWEFWLRNAALADVVDFITIHILPYWEDFPISAAQAAAHVDAIRARLNAAFPGKEILIGEVGWPSAGRMREGALPSPVNQARVLHEVLAAAQRGGYRVNVIEAFDQPWKRRLEGTVGGYWGLFTDGARTAKFRWGMPVSDHPRWRLQALAGVLLAGLTFLSGFLAARAAKRVCGLTLWSAMAAMALVSGVLFGWTLEKATFESLELGGWLHAAALVGVALAAAPLAAAGLVREERPSRFAVLLGGERGRVNSWLAGGLGFCLMILGVLAVQVLLGLVFDPRYRDFPFSALWGATFPFFLLSFARGPSKGEAAGLAERAMAATLAVGVVYVTFNEGFANWQSLATVSAAAALVVTLLRGGGAPVKG